MEVAQVVQEVQEVTDKLAQVELVNNIQFQVQMFIMLAEVPAVEEVLVVLRTDSGSLGVCSGRPGVGSGVLNHHTHRPRAL